MDLSDRLSSVYWIGGSTCAGKSTIAKALSIKHNCSLYYCDEHLGKHIEKSNPNEQPSLYSITKMSWNDILSMKVEEYLNFAINLFTEEFSMIINDLLCMSNEMPIIVEGVGLLPELIKSSGFNMDHAFWLVADDLYYREHQINRKEIFERINQCSDPELAMRNYFRNDLAMGQYIRNNAKMFGLKVFDVKDEIEFVKIEESISSYFDR